jgi:hypothetical protein
MCGALGLMLTYFLSLFLFMAVLLFWTLLVFLLLIYDMYGNFVKLFWLCIFLFCYFNLLCLTDVTCCIFQLLLQLTGFGLFSSFYCLRDILRFQSRFGCLSSLFYYFLFIYKFLDIIS